MRMTSKVILYDLPSKGRCACWSLNPWKTRLALNFKGVPYETKWLEYPDVAPTFKDTGLAPNKQGPAYTIPTVKIDGKLIMDSIAIAPALERLQPSPSLRFDSPMTGKVQDAVTKTFEVLRPVCMPPIPRNLLNPTSKTYFEETRAVRFGMSLSELERSSKAKTAWQDAEAGISELKALLHEQTGPFFLGKEPSYADFIAVGMMQCFKRIENDLFERFINYDQAFATLYDKCGKWLERDDH